MLQAMEVPVAAHAPSPEVLPEALSDPAPGTDRIVPYIYVHMMLMIECVCV